MRVLIISILLIIPGVIFAQSFAGPLVPCGGPECEVCHFFGLGQNILNFLIVIGVILAAIAFVIGGFYMVSSAGDTTKVSRGKTLFTNAVVGLIILLAAWILIDTIMKSLISDEFDQELGAWNDVQCGATSGGAEAFPLEPSPPVQGTPIGGGTTGGSGTQDDDEPLEIVIDGGALSHDDAVQTLSGANVQICSTGSTCTVTANCNGSGCTSLNNIQSYTLTAPIRLKEACPSCDVVVTGGTEPGHSAGTYSHGTGYKIDIDDTPSVQSFLETNLTRDGSRGGNPRYRDSAGNEWVDEGNHWDVDVRQSVSI